MPAWAVTRLVGAPVYFGGRYSRQTAIRCVEPAVCCPDRQEGSPRSRTMAFVLSFLSPVFGDRAIHILQKALSCSGVSPSRWFCELWDLLLCLLTSLRVYHSFHFFSCFIFSMFFTSCVVRSQHPFCCTFFSFFRFSSVDISFPQFVCTIQYRFASRFAEATGFLLSRSTLLCCTYLP